MLRRRHRIERHVALKRSGPLRRKPSTKPTREFVDKTTGEERLILSEADWGRMKRQMWREGRGKLNCGICGERVWRYKDLNPDHVEPRGMGGGSRNDQARNLQPSQGNGIYVVQDIVDRRLSMDGKIVVVR